MAGKNLTRDENAIIANSVVTRTKPQSTIAESSSTHDALVESKTSYTSVSVANGNGTNAVRRTRRRSALTNLNNNVTQLPSNVNTNNSINGKNGASTSSSSSVAAAGPSTTAAANAASSRASSRIPTFNKANNNINNHHQISHNTKESTRHSGARLSLQPTTGSRKERQVHIKKDPYVTEEEDYKQREDGKLIPANQPSSQKNKRAAPDSYSDQADKKAKIEYTWDDLDEEDIDDPLMVSEYVVEIFEYLHKLERETLPDPTYLQWQTNLQPAMRSILVDWLVEIHTRFRLLPETLYLAINLMDRFLSVEIVEVEKFQLLATSCLFIAAKYEEVYSPSVKNYALVTDGGFSEDEILQAEKAVVEVLEFNMSYPNPMNFLRRISKADDYEVRTRTLGKYLMEITVIDFNFIGVLPSMAAAAAMYVARKMLDRGPWNNNLIHFSGDYTEKDLAEVCEMIVKYLVSPIVHQEFFRKYSSRKYMKASILARQWAKALVAEGRSVMDSSLDVRTRHG